MHDGRPIDDPDLDDVRDDLDRAGELRGGIPPLPVAGGIAPVGGAAIAVPLRIDDPGRTGAGAPLPTAAIDDDSEEARGLAIEQDDPRQDDDTVPHR